MSNEYYSYKRDAVEFNYKNYQSNFTPKSGANTNDKLRGTTNMLRETLAHGSSGSGSSTTSGSSTANSSLQNSLPGPNTFTQDGGFDTFHYQAATTKLKGNDGATRVGFKNGQLQGSPNDQVSNCSIGDKNYKSGMYDLDYVEEGKGTPTHTKGTSENYQMGSGLDRDQALTALNKFARGGGKITDGDEQALNSLMDEERSKLNQNLNNLSDGELLQLNQHLGNFCVSKDGNTIWREPTIEEYNDSKGLGDVKWKEIPKGSAEYEARVALLDRLNQNNSAPATTVATSSNSTPPTEGKVNQVKDEIGQWTANGSNNKITSEAAQSLTNAYADNRIKDNELKALKEAYQRGNISDEHLQALADSGVEIKSVSLPEGEAKITGTDPYGRKFDRTYSHGKSTAQEKIDKILRNSGLSQNTDLYNNLEKSLTNAYNDFVLSDADLGKIENSRINGGEYNKANETLTLTAEGVPNNSYNPKLDLAEEKTEKDPSRRKAKRALVTNLSNKYQSAESADSISVNDTELIKQLYQKSSLNGNEKSEIGNLYRLLALKYNWD